jgi:hypothetical protein
LNRVGGTTVAMIASLIARALRPLSDMSCVSHTAYSSAVRSREVTVRHEPTSCSPS